MSEPMAGRPANVSEDEWRRRHLEHNLKSAARGDPEEWRHPDIFPELDIEEVNKTLNEIHAESYKERHADEPTDDIDMQEAAQDFMYKMGMTPTPDATGQLLEVFVPCLRIMCERGYEPTGALWRQAGLFNIMGDVKKKFQRYWYRTWTEGKRHDDSGLDLINFTGFTLRIDPDSRFGDSGEPAPPRSES